MRHVPAGGEALTTRRRGTEGRFHRPGEIALYLADEPETAWGEWYRALAERAQAPNDDVPRDLHRISVSLDQVVDLSTAAARTTAGLPTRMRPAASHVATRRRSSGLATPVRRPARAPMAAQSAAPPRELKSRILHGPRSRPLIVARRRAADGRQRRPTSALPLLRATCGRRTAQSAGLTAWNSIR
jgi:RES domain